MMAPELLSRIAAGYSVLLAENLTGIYLHGSMAFGCFRPETGDIDFLIVLRDEPSPEVKRRLIKLTIELDADAPPKGLEMSVVLERDCRNVRHPVPFSLHYSAAHRAWYARNPEEYIEKMHGTDPDLAAYFGVIRKVGKTLCGTPAAELFSEVPHEAFLDSIRRNVQDDASDASAVLNLCRYAAFRQDGEILSKAGGGEWALQKLPERWRRLIRNALDIYAGQAPESTDPACCQAFRREVTAPASR